MRPLSLFVALSAVLLGSCYSPGDGKPPPLEQIYFPTGLALDTSSLVRDTPTSPLAPHYLYIASSDFDLQYRSSSLASYDLEVLHHQLPTNCNTDADCTGGKVCDAYSPDAAAAADPKWLPSYFCVAAARNTGELPAVPDVCAPLAVRLAADQLLSPGRCQSIDPTIPWVDPITKISLPLIVDTMGIGAFATDVIFKAAPPDMDARNRLFLPVRGDATLHWLELNYDGADPKNNEHMLDCGGVGFSDPSCDDAHRVGDDMMGESTDNLRQPSEPFGIAVDPDGVNIAITNQTSGSVSLFANQWIPKRPPMLNWLLMGLPNAPIGIAALPKPDLPKAAGDLYQPGFLVVYEDAPEVDLLRVRVDPADASECDKSLDPKCTYSTTRLLRAGAASINANSLGSDSRGILIDDTQRKADYAVCDAACPDGATSDDSACKDSFARCVQAVHQPSVFVSNRAPNSLLVGAMTADFGYASGTSELPSFTDSLPLQTGPSRVVLGHVKVPSAGHAASEISTDEHGSYALETRIFAVCFDARRIYIYDPQRAVIDSIVTTGRGPFALAIDDQRGLGYVAHFTDSYLGVISLDQRFPRNYAAIIGSVGIPTAPRASK